MDSDLLRFLSSEKIFQKENERLEKQLKSGVSDMTSIYLSTLTSRTKKRLSIGESSRESWLGQYNQQRVAAVLSAKGAVDESLARAAGERVQAHALARTSRRRIREFLRERDKAWGNTAAGGLFGTSNQSLLGKSIAASLSYSFEDVVDLLLNYGLSVRDVSEILVHSPSIALMQPRPFKDGKGESLQCTIDRAFVGVLCGTLKLRKYDARKVLRNSPGLLSMRGSRAAEEIVTLLSQLGVSTNSIARDKATLPKLLSRSPAAVFRLVSFLTSNTVRVPIDKIGPILRKRECLSLLYDVAPTPQDANYEKVDAPHHGFGDATDPESVSAHWGSTSELRNQRIEEVYRNMTETVRVLRYKIGITDVGNVISAYPGVLLLDAKHKIIPTTDYLMNALNIWEEDLPKILRLYPALLGEDIGKMDGVVTYLLSLGVDPSNLPIMFRSFPMLLTLDVNKDMKPVVNFLRSIGIVNIGRFISRLPPVLGYSVSRELQPKWQFLKKTIPNARFEVSKFPACFSYPLERVTKTRYKYLKEVKRLPTQLVSLDQVLRFGDRDFAVKVAGDTDNGRNFDEYAEKRRIEASDRESTKKKRKTKKK